MPRVARCLIDGGGIIRGAVIFIIQKLNPMV